MQCITVPLQGSVSMSFIPKKSFSCNSVQPVQHKNEGTEPRQSYLMTWHLTQKSVTSW